MEKYTSETTRIYEAGVVQHHINVAPDDVHRTNRKRSATANPTGLDSLLEPRVGQLDAEGIHERDAIVNNLERFVVKKKDDDSVYRLGSVPVKFKNGKVICSNLAPSTIKPAKAIHDCFDQVRRHCPQEPILQIVHTILEVSGQLAYLEEHIEALNEAGWDIEVSIDYYRDRKDETAGYLHKDTVGNTLFVTLLHLNKETTKGPEYMINPELIDSHVAMAKSHLPELFWEHLQEQWKKTPKADYIHCDDLLPDSWVSFVDELIHHGTPLLKSRAIPPHQFDRLRRFLGDQVETVRRKIDELISISPPMRIYKKDLIDAGVDAEKADRVFYSIFETNPMDHVALASCEDHCHKALTFRQPALSNPKLQRRISELLIQDDPLVRQLCEQARLPERSPRGFLRFWVQAVPRHPSSQAKL